MAKRAKRHLPINTDRTSEGLKETPKYIGNRVRVLGVHRHERNWILICRPVES